jgi:hypothetical protein
MFGKMRTYESGAAGDEYVFRHENEM